jgi:ketosteroid isomerase-like protein
MADAVKATRRYDQAFDTQDAGAREAHQTPDIEVVLPGGLILRGPEQVAQVVRSFWEALPDGRILYDNELAAGDTVVIEGRWTQSMTALA